jgi:hypothetical protein
MEKKRAFYLLLGTRPVKTQTTQENLGSIQVHLLLCCGEWGVLIFKSIEVGVQEDSIDF